MDTPPATASLDERISMGLRCRDADPVPKVADAGEVYADREGRRVQIMHNGLRVICDGYYGSWMTNLIRQGRGHHEPQEERLFHEVVSRLPEDARMIELGGFWSYYSLWFLLHRPQRRAVVIEPEPAHLEIGRTNAFLNDLHPTFLEGFVGADYAASAPFTNEAGVDMATTCYSVPHLLEQQQWPSLDLLHCDIQGHEAAVLESCRPLFEAGRIGWVFVSTHAHPISGDPLTHQRCLAVLRDCGAMIEAEHDVHESFSGDGLIVARFGPAPEGWTPVELSYNRHSRALFRSLAYDLDESRKATARLEARIAAFGRIPDAIHPSLVKRGVLYELGVDGPLGPRGASVLLRDDEVMAPAIVANAAWEFDNVEQFARHLQKGKRYTLVDIGANIGMFSRQIARAAPEIERILCVEPEPKNFEALSFNMKPFEDKATLFNAALGDADAARTFFRDRDNTGNYSLNPDAMRGRRHDEAQVTQVETGGWMQAQLETAEAIAWKSDTQGFDEVIITRTPMEIWRRIDVAIIEIWRIAKPDFDRDALRSRLEDFPHRQLGEEAGIGIDAIMDYLDGDDREFRELLLWR